jgi:hypothetical protein
MRAVPAMLHQAVFEIPANEHFAGIFYSTRALMVSLFTLGVGVTRIGVTSIEADSPAQVADRFGGPISEARFIKSVPPVDSLSRFSVHRTGQHAWCRAPR